MDAVVHTLALTTFLLAAAGAVYCLGALSIDVAGPRLSSPARTLCWRLVAVKLVGIAILTITLAASSSR